MDDDPTCPECGKSIRPGESVARHPDGMCHIHCLPTVTTAPPEAGQAGPPSPTP